MDQERSPEEERGSGFVKDIFERKKQAPDTAKKISALFGGTASREIKGRIEPEKKRLPQELSPIGVDISGLEVRAVQLAKIDGQLEVVRAASRRFTSEASKAGEMKELLSENNLKGDAVIGLSAKEIQIRLLSLPPMPSAEVESAVSWQIAEVLGIEARKINEFSIDYSILAEPETRASAAEKKVLVAAVRKDAVLDRIEEISSMGLNVIAVEPGPLALFAGLSQISAPDESKLNLLLDIGYDVSSLSIAIGQDVYLVQNIATTDNLFTQAIKDYFQVDYDDAESLKHHYGLESWSSIPSQLAKAAAGAQNVNSLKAALASNLENLIVDIEHSYKSLSNQLARSVTGELSRIIVCGSGAKLKGIDTFLKNTFNIPVAIFNPLSNMVMGDEIADRSEIKESGMTFGTAIGLALRRKEEDETAKSNT